MREAATELLVDLDPLSNVTDLLQDQRRKDPEHALYARKVPGGWDTVTAARFEDRVRAVARGLIAAGLVPGGTVAVMSRTRFEWTLVDFAIWYAGGVTVPIYETSSRSQVSWILSDSGAKIVLVEDEAKRDLVREASGSADGPGPSIWSMTESADGADLASLEASGAGVDDDALERARSAAGLADVASLVYTSGTTGRPKGCEITHGNFALVARNTILFLPEILDRPDTRTLMFLPLAHVLARAVQVICLAAGTTVAHAASAAELIEDLGTFKPTFLLAVPRVFEKVYATAQQNAEEAGKGRVFELAARTAIDYSKALDAAARGTGRGPRPLLRIRHALFDRLVFARVRAAFGGDLQHIVSGASALNPREAHFFRGAGLILLEGYGLTESTAPCTANTPSHTKVGTVGIPMPGTTIRVAADGEVLVKGIGIFRGYHRNDAANAEAFADGFFRTGDLGELDEDGFLTITGRKKDLLVTAGGKNVAPGPLEEKLRESRLVSQAVVVGEGRPFVGALLTLDPDGLAAWCRARKTAVLTPAQAAASPQVLAELQGAVDAANELVSRAEGIRKFRVLDTDFTVESGLLTPSLKLKRASVLEAYADDVEGLYAK